MVGDATAVGLIDPPNLPSVQIALTAVASGTFAYFVVSVRTHFAGDRIPFGMVIVSLVSFFAFCLLLAQIWATQLVLVAACVGVAGQLAALGLFRLAILATRQRRLTLAFSQDQPTFLVDRGPYRLIRHPFYTAYVIYWWSGAFETLSVWCSLAAMGLTAVYVIAAVKEERKFAASHLATEYAAYRGRAGLMWPKLSFAA